EKHTHQEHRTGNRRDQSPWTLAHVRWTRDARQAWGSPLTGTVAQAVHRKKGSHGGTKYATDPRRSVLIKFEQLVVGFLISDEETRRTMRIAARCFCCCWECVVSRGVTRCYAHD